MHPKPNCRFIDKINHSKIELTVHLNYTDGIDDLEKTDTKNFHYRKMKYSREMM